MLKKKVNKAILVNKLSRKYVHNLTPEEIEERKYIELLKSDLNKYVPGRTKKEYREDNKDNILKQRKQYYETHKDKILENMKTYYNNKKNKTDSSSED